MKDGKPCVSGHDGLVGESGDSGNVRAVLQHWFDDYADTSDAGYACISHDKLEHLARRLYAYTMRQGYSVLLNRTETGAGWARFATPCGCDWHLTYTPDGPSLVWRRCALHDVVATAPVPA